MSPAQPGSPTDDGSWPGPAQRLHSVGPVLTDGGVETALVYDMGYDLPELGTVGMLDDPQGRLALTELWTGYLEIARRYGLPMVVGTPTWRGGPDRMAQAGRPPSDVARLNAEAVAFQRELATASGMGAATWVAGVLGPRFDGYDPGRAPGVAEAAAYHGEQCGALNQAGADFLFAVPLPSADEAVGVSQAMAATGAPYVPSLILDAQGHLPDGTGILEVLARFEGEVDTPPLHVAVSCVHPRTLIRAVHSTDGGGGWARVRQLKANGSALPPAVLDRSTHLECDSPEVWAEAMMAVAETLDLTVMGGCCGTSGGHLSALAARLVARRRVP